MSWAYLVGGMVIGAVVFTGALAITDAGSISVDGDAACQEGFGESWTATNTTQNMNGTVSVGCQNETHAKQVTVDIQDGAL